MRRLLDLTLIVSVVVAVASLVACRSEPLSGPPTEMKLGRHECAECGMIVSEDRCSSALLVEEDGRREYLYYDDLGCMLDDERTGMGDRTVIERHVHDYDTKAWVDATKANFLFTDTKALHTPMGSGMVAFALQTSAEAARGRHGGQVVTYAELAKLRAQWMHERYGKPESDHTDAAPLATPAAPTDPHTPDPHTPGAPAPSMPAPKPD